MIFSELYSAYYNTVSHILARIIEGERDEKKLRELVEKYAFGESAMTVFPSLLRGKWQLLHKNMTTPIRKKPTLPLTNLQKRWLKAISLDPRIRLFDVNFDELCDVEPLFTEEDYCIYDRYTDGDPFTDEGYIKRFRFLLLAIREKAEISILVKNRNGKAVRVNCIPKKLEYSEKDDKFRLLTCGSRYARTINLAKIISCERYENEYAIKPTVYASPYKTLTLKIRNERNALERCMLHFAHFEKQAERLGDAEYLVHIRYDLNDEAEMVIRVLSFGPMVEAIAPLSFRELIIEKLKKQKSCELK